jgi:hypothetical protein
MTCRTWIGCWVARPPGQDGRDIGGDLNGARFRLTSTIW